MNWRLSVKVGDLVNWKPMNDFGTIVEIQPMKGCNWKKYKIMWHIDIGAADGHHGMWYDNEDFGDEGNIEIV